MRVRKLTKKQLLNLEVGDVIKEQVIWNTPDLTVVDKTITSTGFVRLKLSYWSDYTSRTHYTSLTINNQFNSKGIKTYHPSGHKVQETYIPVQVSNLVPDSMIE